MWVGYNQVWKNPMVVQVGTAIVIREKFIRLKVLGVEVQGSTHGFFSFLS